eukprot:1205503-Prorocentrum_lima.AAC.1
MAGPAPLQPAQCVHAFRPIALVFGGSLVLAFRSSSADHCCCHCRDDVCSLSGSHTRPPTGIKFLPPIT